MSFSPRYLVVVNLVLLALAAYSASAIVGTALSARLTQAPKVEISAPPAPIPQHSTRPSSFYALIQTRDIFNSVQPDDTGPPPTPGPPPPSDLNLKLWGVAVHDSEAESYCIIEDVKKREQLVYKVGAEVAPSTTVHAVEWDRVVLLRGGSEEILELEEGLTGKKGTKPSRFSAAASRGSRASAKTEPIKGVEVVSDTEYIVEREEVDNALENMSQLFTQIRAVPHFEGGESTGFRLFAIRRGSLFDKIGLKNGDIIRNINGQAMNDPTKALGLLEELRDSTDLTVAVTRNRKEKTLNYTVK